MNLRLSSPPLGWNSYDAYGCAASEETMQENLEVFVKRLMPFGYNYFVVDNGWFCEYQLDPETGYPRVKHGETVRLDAYGRYLPSECYFPGGIQRLADLVHQHGGRFGIHLMRGISCTAVKKNLPIKGTPYHASDIADRNSICKWCPYNYGVDMSRPGAQEFYQSVVDQFAQWGVDLIKMDDVTAFPDEINAVRRAIDRCGHPIVFSLSPGGNVRLSHMDAYAGADMLRITSDIWDNREDLSRAFWAWRKFSANPKPGLWYDMDMIPFGKLCVWNKGTGEPEATLELNGKGKERMSALSMAQKRTFLAMRALAASPLFVGGELTTMPEEDFALLCCEEMLRCNQNGVMGSLVWQDGVLEVWNTYDSRTAGAGWFGVFNRSLEKRQVDLKDMELPMLENGVRLTEVFGGATIAGALSHDLEADDVWFFRYENK